MAAPYIEVLGGSRILGRAARSDAAFLEALESGLPVASLDALLRVFHPTNAAITELLGVVGSVRTLQRKRSALRAHTGRKGQPVLSREESDRLARVARLTSRAVEAIGDRDRALRWIMTPSVGLDGRRPLDLLSSDAGTVLVEQELGRIEHGIPA